MGTDRPGEFELIRRFFAPLAKDPGSLGLTDDAAVMTPKAGFDLVLTKDVLAADVHFFSDDPPEAIAAKALRVNLSDLAAKGARPKAYLLGLALPAGWTTGWMDRFCSGLAEDQSTYQIQLLGGDTIRSANGLHVSITAIGEVESGRAVRRSGAKAGDRLFVTGTLGDASAGLKVRHDPGFAARSGFKDADIEHLLDRYLLPRPRTRLAAILPDFANAAMDISDGLYADAGHLASASGISAILELDRIPLSPALRHLKTQSPGQLSEFINGGDDYEILASVSRSAAGDFQKSAAAAGCPVTEIGSVEAGPAGVRMMQDGSAVSFSSRSGFSHF